MLRNEAVQKTSIRCDFCPQKLCQENCIQLMQELSEVILTGGS